MTTDIPSKNSTSITSSVACVSAALGNDDDEDDDDNDNDDDNCVETPERHVRVSCVSGYLFIRPRISYLPHICFLRVEAPRALLELENASFMTPSHTPSFPFRSSGMFTQTLSSA